MKKYEVRYTDKKGRYTEETFSTRKEALEREFALHRKGINCEVWVVSE